MSSPTAFPRPSGGLLLPFRLALPAPAAGPVAGRMPAEGEVVTDRLALESGSPWSCRGTLRVDEPDFRTGTQAARDCTSANRMSVQRTDCR